MGTKTIGIREEVYERLKARKRSEESFTDLVDRLLDEATVDWEEGFGALDSADVADLEDFADEVRADLGEGLSKRQEAVVSDMKDGNEAS